ncbi:PAS domain-containing protein [Mangrovicoccus sp. HB161399]|uniref:PAS domain-containing protein n=1 Tax=Mangrovicoccus sp. HB161399 TaxID=2720392 RepID=UPI0015516942|nr:PAS domain-containing protein [Mangrovicoccus sp. HB161399]
MEDGLQQYSRVVQDLPGPACLVAPDGRILSANAAMAAALGYPPQDLAGRQPGEFCSPGFGEMIAAAQARLVEEGSAESSSAAFRLGDGSERYFDCVFTPLGHGGDGGLAMLELQPPCGNGRPPAEGAREPAPLPREDHYRVLNDAAATASFGQWYLQLDSRKFWATDSFYSLLGYAPFETQIDSLWLRSQVHPDDIGMSLAAVEDLIRDRSSQVRFEYRLRCRDGRYKWFEASSRKVEGDGLPPMLCGSLIDIDRRKASAERLRNALVSAQSARAEVERNGEMLRIATEAGGAVAWHFDPATGLVTYTMPPRLALGYSDEDLTQPISNMQGDVHPDDAASVREALGALVEGRSERSHVDYRKRHRDGTWMWFSSEARPMLGSGGGEGRPDLICGITMDITARKRAEEALRGAVDDARAARDETEKSRKRLQYRMALQRVASESSNVVPWYIIPSTGEEEVGPHLGTLLGYSSSFRIRGTEMEGLMHPDDRSAATAAFEELLSGRRREMSHDLRLRRRDGSWCWISSVGKHVDNAAGSMPGMVCGSLVDISVRKAYEARLADALQDAESARQAAKANAEMLGIAAKCGEIGAWRIGIEPGDAWMEDEGFRQLGYEPGAFVPDFEGWGKLVHPEDIDDARHRLKGLLHGERGIYESEMRILHADGSYHWYRFVGRKIDRSVEGLPPFFAGAHTRIDALKENERQLARALEAAQDATATALLREEVMALTSESGQVGHFMIYPELGEGVAPDLTYRLLGYEPGGFPCTDAGWRALHHPDDIGAAIDEMEALFAGKIDVYDIVNRLRHWDGSYHWYRVVARKIDRAAQGLPFVLAGAIFNIDAQRASETRLANAAEEARQAVDRLNVLANRAPGALFEYQSYPDGRMDFHYFSAALPDIMGVDPEALAANGKAIYTNIRPEDVPEAKRLVERARASKQVFEYQHRIDHPTRGLRWILVKALPYDNEDGSTTWFGNTLDVTEELEVERRAREAGDEAKAAHDRLNTIAENSPGALFELLLHPDRSAEWRYFNAKLPELVGVSSGDMAADAYAIFANISPEEAEQITNRFFGELDEFTDQVEIRFSLQHPERGLRWLLCSASPARHEDGSVVWYGNIMDITERLEIEYLAAEAAAEVHKAHNRLSMIADIAPVGLYEFRRKPDGSQDLPYASRRFEELLGITEIEGSGTEGVFRRIDPQDLPTVITTIDDSARTMSQWKVRFRLHHPTRGLLWLSASSIPRQEEDGSIIWTGAMHDVTADVLREAELRRAHELAETMRAENERQALHDGLTGLPNRRYYDNMMAKRLDYAQNSKVRDCVLIRVDLDHFKYVNDTLGHEAGDLVLMRVAEVLRNCLRGEDFASRIGGDEFSIILAPGMTEENAREIVERIQVKLAEPLVYDGRLCRFGASFGIAHTDNLTALGPELQLFADAALYKAKDGGRNRMEFFTTDLHQGILNDRRLASEIHAGMERDEFVPYFQPQVTARDGSLVGVETLLRWNHPERGVLVPGDFMHVAEQLRLVPEIDRIMMLKSRDALKRWRAKGLVIPKISFNVSSGRMHDPDVVDMARSLLDGETKVAFELLESILVEEESDAFKFHVDMIREAGIEIEIDDFGSGHASIIGLMEIAPQALKIDRRIVMPVARDDRAKNLLRAIVEIAETLGIKTIAEGVETEEQIAILRQAGCDMLQGYVYSRPLSEDALTSYLSGGIQKSA